MEVPWSTDVLGPPYEATTLHLPPDDEGEVVATLVRRRVPATVDGPSRRAVLYVHGWVDYFFQTHLADWFVERGWDFYALDLRKSGRSLAPHQTPYFCRSIAEYFAELDLAARVVREVDGHDTLLVDAHSTGGLVTSLWAHRLRGRGMVQGLALNSPFLDLAPTPAIRAAVRAVSGRYGVRRPYAVLPIQADDVYGRSLHREHGGEWDYDLRWKPLLVTVRAGWLRAVRLAHRQVHAGLEIDVPVLVQCSAASSLRGVRGRRSAEQLLTADGVLDVEQIARWSPRLGPHVTLLRVDGGMHDLVLSARPVREHALDDLGRWTDAWLPGSDRQPVTRPA